MSDERYFQRSAQLAQRISQLPGYGSFGNIKYNFNEDQFTGVGAEQNKVKKLGFIRLEADSDLVQQISYYLDSIIEQRKSGAFKNHLGVPKQIIFAIVFGDSEDLRDKYLQIIKDGFIPHDYFEHILPYQPKMLEGEFVLDNIWDFARYGLLQPEVQQQVESFINEIVDRLIRRYYRSTNTKQLGVSRISNGIRKETELDGHLNVVEQKQRVVRSLTRLNTVLLHTSSGFNHTRDTVGRFIENNFHS